MPVVAVAPHDQPNAFATGRSPAKAVVAVTTGILRAMPQEELEGVIAHELAHIKNRDMLISTIAAGIAGFDNTMLTGLAGISLTSVDTDTAALADGAVSLLRERQEGRTGRRDLIVPPRVVPRASTRRA